jgi:hypothetical protein
LKKEVKWQNEFQLEEEIRNFQKMRLANADEEDQELKEIFEKTRKNTQPTQRPINEDSDDEVPSSRKKTSYDSDEMNDIDSEIPEKQTSGRGRGSRGGSTRARGRGSRGGRGGRGAKAAAVEENKTFSSSNTTRAPLVKKQPSYVDDSEPEIIDLDDGKKSQDKESKFFPVKSLATTPSVRRTRIDYDDDEDDENMFSNSKKTKLTTTKIEDDDIPNTFSIFKKVAKKK